MQIYSTFQIPTIKNMNTVIKNKMTIKSMVDNEVDIDIYRYSSGL